MTVLIMENAPSGLRGEISKWMIEVTAGVFIGKVSALVREKLWKKIMDKSSDATFYLIWTTNNEQGFEIRDNNPKQYVPIDYEGITLIRKS